MALTADIVDAYRERMTVARKKSVEDLICQAMTDKSFRDRLLANPEEALESEGYDVTPEVIQAIKAANADEVNALCSAPEVRATGWHTMASTWESNLADRKAAA